jgi:hypothetical protein
VTLETHLIDEGSLSFPHGGAEAIRLEVALLVQRLEDLHDSSGRSTDEGGASSLDILTPAGHSSSHRIQNDPGHNWSSPRRGLLVALVVQLKQVKGEYFKGSPSQDFKMLFQR